MSNSSVEIIIVILFYSSTIGVAKTASKSQMDMCDWLRQLISGVSHLCSEGQRKHLNEYSAVDMS